MGRFGVGQAVRRVEDQRLLTGQGQFSDDINLPGQAVSVVLRSPFAHADIVNLDKSAAEAAPGVLAVYSADDLSADGIGDIPCLVPMAGKNGSGTVEPPHPVLARGRVRHVGDPVAFVVAGTLAQARDAAELIEVEYENLPAVSGTDEALAPGAPRIWEDAPDNLCLDWEIGDAAAARAAFDKAAHVTTLRLVNNRLVVAPIEPRAALGEYETDSETLVLRTSTQGGMRMRPQLARQIFDVPDEKVRIVTPDVGGSFGMKIFLYAEQVMVLYAARKLGRPVKWTGDRTDCFLSDSQGRDQIVTAQLALDENARILALRSSGVANLGAYLSNFAPLIPTGASGRMFCGLYRIPTMHMEVKCVFTNTVPVDAYRGAGRPEAAYIVERLIDAAARELGLPPDEMRRRNFVRPADLPYATPTDVTYDSGDYPALMARAMDRADWAGIEARKAAARARGRRRGIGLASYVEACSAVGEEDARIRMDEDGGATVWIGTQTNGQGHATAYMQLLNDKLGLEPDMIRVRQGDTAEWAKGGGTGGSRSLLMGGLAIEGAAELVLERARKVAGHLLEAAEADLEFAAGSFTIVGTDRRIALGAVTRAAAGDASLPVGLRGVIDEVAHQGTPSTTFPNGCHVCELEVEEDTGRIEIVNYVAVDDFGTLVNPLLVAGQVHGGIVQGIGQALLEHTVYDPDSGQLLTGSFMDYCLPRADDLPGIDLLLVEDYPCATNPMGVKGAGEAGAIGAPPAVINALVDALAELGIAHIDMPATPLRVWQAIQDAQRPAKAAE